MPIISALGRLRQEDAKFRASLGCIMNLSLLQGAIFVLGWPVDLTSVIFPHVFYTTIFLNYEKSPEFRGMTAVRVPASRVLDGNTVSSRQRERPHR